MLALLFAYSSLCDPHFDRREAATARLAHLIDRHPMTYGPRLGDLVRGATCPEVRSRAMRVLAGYARWRVYAYVPRGVPVWPICDAYPLPCVVLPAFAMEDVRDRWAMPSCDAPPGAMLSGPHWGRWRAGTERMVRERLRAGATWEDCDVLVARMWRLEVRARHDCGAVLDVRAWAGGYP